MIELIIVIITCLTMIASIIFFPAIKLKKIHISTYWFVALIGALVLLIGGFLSIKTVSDGLFSNSAINPLKILILFLSMTFLSIFLDEIGFFKYLANLVLKKSGAKQTKLFILLYIIVSILTVFTSNDIIILTFTPFICYFCKNAKINPLPFLFCEFVAANTWSMMFIIGNPTNIYLATSASINFIDYFLVMIIPTIFAGLSSFGILFLIFRKTLAKKIEQPVIENYKIEDKNLLIIGLAHLGLCTILLVIASYINLDMWAITFAFALSLVLFIAIYHGLVKKKKPAELINSVKRLPYELIPFVISMFIIVLCLKETGLLTNVANLLDNGNPIFLYGVTSFLSANLINNIPMSVLFEVLASNAVATSYHAAIYSSVIGSNIGALLTPIGALAGIMWIDILKKHDVRFSFVTFVKYGAPIAIVSITFALIGLYLVL